MNLLTVSGLKKKEGQNPILQGIDFTLQTNEKLAIVGESGAGKTTLLKLVAGLSQADEGTVMLEDKRVRGVHEKLMPGHPGIAYLSQHFELWNNYRVEEVLSYSNKLTDEASEVLYRTLHIDHLAKRKTNELSGGEKQRIAMARLLNGAPKLFILDEPFSNLDLGHKQILKRVLNDLGEQLHTTFILTSHDPLDTLAWADRIIVMKNGQIVQEGTPEEVYKQPVNEYVASLFGPFNLLNDANAQVFAALPGMKQDGKQLLVRPENFRLVAGGSQAIKGNVERVNYMGSHYEIEIRSNNQVLTVRNVGGNFQKGDEVFITITPGGGWLL
ncbi:ABC-type sugar transport system ATPase subunit [Chitinophaga skermanii]|uniref:ABC-type sugar transport system ATPase subunit n=1 Tax=Chitinophaga skermanii TaxID=331697 RepID=A0A327QL37_9BACT|nr:ABC transporter ATP-binding protein [Chitinophaga skermanii]RAJ05031.1 ABC-type sugar transport system ATPase subunit [Chitinophaga skermanii]